MSLFIDIRFGLVYMYMLLYTLAKLLVILFYEIRFQALKYALDSKNISEENILHFCRCKFDAKLSHFLYINHDVKIM